MPRFRARWLLLPACAGMTIGGAVAGQAKNGKIEAVQFPVMTTTQSDSLDPSLPASAPASPAATQAASAMATNAVRISGDVAAEIARQLADAVPASGSAGKPPQHRVYAVREPAGTMLPGSSLRTIAPLPIAPAIAPGPKDVDETAVLSRMLEMNRSQVMRGVADTVKRTSGGKADAAPTGRGHRGSGRIEAQRLNPDLSGGMRRFDPDQSANP